MTGSQVGGQPELSGYGEELAAAFGLACRQQPPLQIHLRIADLTIALHLSGKQMGEVLLPGLAHLLSDAEEMPADVCLHAWESAGSDVWPPRPPFGVEAYRRYGQRAIAHNGGRSLMHDSTEKR